VQRIWSWNWLTPTLHVEKTVHGELENWRTELAGGFNFSLKWEAGINHPKFTRIGTYWDNKPSTCRIPIILERTRVNPAMWLTLTDVACHEAYWELSHNRSYKKILTLTNQACLTALRCNLADQGYKEIHKRHKRYKYYQILLSQFPGPYRNCK
jgi:hypothetical protein